MKSHIVKLTKIKQFYFPVDAEDYKKIKQFYFPVDAEDYKLLRSHGMPVIKIHENLLPTLGIIFKKYGIKPQAVAFSDAILDPYLDRIGAAWFS